MDDVKSGGPATAGGVGAAAGKLASALEREHHEIDHGIEAFLAALAEGRTETEPLLRAIAALRRHIFLEEEILFPPLRHAGFQMPIFVMLREHGEIWDTLAALDAKLASDPAGAATSECCRDLLGRLERHNAKEEPILYPPADTVLTPAVAATLEGFLDTGELPPGWACAQASA